MISHSRCCRSCLKFQGDGICAQYHKMPPDGFAARCRHFELSRSPQKVKRACSECERFDEDENGKWCRLPDTADGWITFRPVREGMECPLN